jgi:hypothetical protein
MPQEVGYRQQVGTAAPANLPDANPGAFGAGIGAGLADIGGALHNSEMRAIQIERQQKADSEAADFSAKFARIREAADQASIDARNNAQPGGAGHADAIGKWYDEQTTSLIDGITDDRVRRSAQTQLQEFGGRLRSNEYQWQEGKRVGKVVTDTRETMQAASNRARRSYDPGAFAEELKIGRASIETMPGVPADVKEQLTREWDETVTVGFFNGVIDTNPKGVAPLLDSGQFDDMLSPQQIERLRSGAELEVRRVDAAAKAEATHAVVLKKEQLATRRAELDAGAGTPQDWAGLATEYEALGDTSSAVTARTRGTTMAAGMAFRGEMPAQLDTRIAELNAKQQAGGLTATEAATRNGLIDLRGQTVGMLNQPGGALKVLQWSTGKPIAPIDPNDPASMRARGAQATAAAQTAGRAVIEPILDTELPTFRDLAHGTAQQRMQALQIIQQFGSPQAIAGAAAQIAGRDDGALRIASQLPTAIARDVLRGEETLKTQPAVWNNQRAAADFQSWYGRALGFVGGTYRSDVMAAAKAYYAQRAVDGGETAYNPSRFAEAVETVMGKPMRWGASRSTVIVPRGMDPKQVEQRFARSDAAAYRRASGGHVPRWSDGSSMNRGDFAKLIPVAVDGAGHYGFRRVGSGDLLQDERGEAYVVDLGRLK